MLKYIGKRILMLIPVLLGVMIIIFFFKVISPGDPIDSLLPSDATEEERQIKREELGLDEPVIIQFKNYVVGVLHGDLGTSYKSGAPVRGEVLGRLKVSVVICFGAVLLGLVMGLPLGVISALKKYTLVDSSILVISMFFSSVPNFCLGLFMIYFFSVKLGVLPATGITTIKGFVMPIAVIALISMSRYTRITRSSMLESLSNDFIRTARAKGQKESKITIRHALRNALIPVINAVGTQMGHQLGGALVLETVFGIPGVGKYVADAILSRNYPSLLGGVLTMAFFVTIVNLVVDLLFVVVDPRLKKSLLSSKKIKKVKVCPEGGR